jgi:catechol 2,3-dioxygenase-like lactoylglutathione lyase family enzyme
MTQFQLNGINHLALVCKDMSQTLDFYQNILGLKLIKTITLPGGGQHFFFDIGNNAPEAVPGIASVKLEGLETGDIVTAHASMNHVAFKVPVEKLEEYCQKLTEQNIAVTPILHHADVPQGYVAEPDETTFISSFYFFDPNGILLEFAATVRQLGDPEQDLQQTTHSSV